MIYIILLVIAAIILIIGTFTDIRKREVPDWISFAGIFAGIGIRLLYSAVTFDWMFVVYGAAGLAIFVGIGYMMFYAGQWGGGDAKILMGIGALIGFDFTFSQFPLIIIFLINALLVGAIYGLLFSIGLSIKNKKKFSKDFKKLIHDSRKWRIIIMIVSLVLLVLVFAIKNPDARLIFLTLLIFGNILFYLWLFVKSVETSSMFKNIKPEELTEGEWIAKEYKIDGEYICGPKDLGIEKKQIKKLIALKKKGKIKKIRIKIGIPFVPSFLIAFIITIILGGWWIYFL